MAERPILFSAPMVRAILEGRKTVTRRVARAIPWHPGVNEKFSQARAFSNGGEFRIAGSEEMTGGFRCPYGKPGDRLYVRETTYRIPHPAAAGLTPKDMPRTWDTACDIAGQVLYRASMEDRTAQVITDGQPWTPSIHMPKDRARIWLEVTAVRVERLQDITEAQAIAEGIEPVRWGDGENEVNWRDYMRDGDEFTDPRASFGSLWRSINGAGSVDANPWVWVVEFRRIPTGGLVHGEPGGLIGEEGCTSYLHESKLANAGIG